MVLASGETQHHGSGSSARCAKNLDRIDKATAAALAQAYDEIEDQEDEHLYQPAKARLGSVPPGVGFECRPSAAGGKRDVRSAVAAAARGKSAERQHQRLSTVRRRWGFVLSKAHEPQGCLCPFFISITALCALPTIALYRRIDLTPVAAPGLIRLNAPLARASLGWGPCRGPPRPKPARSSPAMCIAPASRAAARMALCRPPVRQLRSAAW